EEVTYAYDDLAFISHSEVLIQFVDENADERCLNFHVHRDLEEAAFRATKAKYEITAAKQGIALLCQGRFRMEAKEGREEIDRQFFPAS
ncbi:MAG: hypothetical protein ACLFR7_11030, partial [Opitutales bacterium]